MSAAEKKKQKRSFPGYRWHKFIWFAAYPFVALVMRIKCHFRTKRYRPPHDTYLVYANHLTNMDQFLLMMAFPKHMYFVASEHLTRHKLHFLIRILGAPILRLKSKTETACAMDILRHLRAGHSVCVFMEGERSYDGCTAHIPDTAGHLAKIAGCALVNYRLENGYFTQPRWSRYYHPGKMWGHVVRTYSPEELKSMSRDEIQAAICQDLWCDAYAEQEKNPIRFSGKALAENLETALFMCPCCGGIATLSSQGDRFSCNCGLKLRYTEYGMLESVTDRPAPFTTVRDWYAWQRGALEKLVEERLQQPDVPIFRDARGQHLRVMPMGSHDAKEIGIGGIALYCDRLELTPAGGKPLSFPLKQVREISCLEQMLLSFSAGDEVYEIRSDYPRSAVKYQLAFRALREIRKQQQAEAGRKTGEDAEIL